MLFNIKLHNFQITQGGIKMIHSINTNLMEKINSLRQKLDYLVKESDGKITQEIIKISQNLDKMLVIYYQQEFM